MPSADIGTRGALLMAAALAGLAVTITTLALVFADAFVQPNFRITLDIETNDGVKTASSVITFRRSGLPYFLSYEDRAIDAHFEKFGHAPMIDIAPYGRVCVQLDRLIGIAIERAYKKPLTDIRHDTDLGKRELSIPIRIIPPDGNSQVVRTLRGMSSRISSDASDNWLELQQRTNSTVTVLAVHAEITNDPIVEIIPNPPDWLKKLRSDARQRDLAMRDLAINRLRYFETGTL